MMLAGIAHEVRNPLGGMTLFAGLLRDELAERRRAPRPRAEDRARARLPRARRQRLPRVRAPAQARARRRRRCADLLAEVAQLAVDARASTVSVAPDAPPTRAPTRGQLRRALLNLAHNAVQAARRGRPPGRRRVRLVARARTARPRALGAEPRQASRAETQRQAVRAVLHDQARRAPASASRSCATSPRDHGGRDRGRRSADGETTFSTRAPVIGRRDGDDPDHRRQRDHPRRARARRQEAWATTRSSPRAAPPASRLQAAARRLRDHRSQDGRARRRRGAARVARARPRRARS